ncbi:MAG: membrane protein insertase YidC [Magnetococcales bacterium]|nr:membrane protein insertase YidC [Magnetococcales bacterium]
MDRRTTLAIGLSFLLVVVYQMYMATFFPPAPPETPVAQEQQAVTPAAPGDVPSAASVSPAAAPPIAPPAAVKDAASKTPSVPVVDSEPSPGWAFANGVLSGQVELKGARLNQLQLLRFKEKLTPDSPPITLFHRSGPEMFLAESGFLGGAGAPATPGPDAVWKVDPSSSPTLIRLTWNNGTGLTFEKEFSFAPNSYLVTLTDRVRNTGAQPVNLFHYGHFVRVEPKEESSATATQDFHGPMGYLDNARVQHDYASLKEKEARLDASAGWAGFSDKYYLAALSPEDQENSKRFYFDFDAPAHRVGAVSRKLTAAPGGMEEIKTRMFIGPKEVELLEAQGLALDRSIDYGWFHFLAAPLVKFLLFFYHFTGNFGVAIVVLTFIIKALFFPLANKSYHSMAAMRRLQPKVEELKKIYGDDKQRMQQEMMRLYQEHKVNPLGGCLPIMLQIPVFFALYKVLLLSIEMRHAPLGLWIHDLSEMDPYYVLPLLMGVSMFIQTKLSPPPPDPVQAKVILLLPIVFTFMFLNFPSGLILYWFVNNVLSITQQWYIMKKDAEKKTA